jgi:hypothetical protein
MYVEYMSIVNTLISYFHHFNFNMNKIFIQRKNLATRQLVVVPLELKNEIESFVHFQFLTKNISTFGYSNYITTSI